MHRITTLEELDALYGEPVGAAVTKEIDYISDHYKVFIDKAPFVVLATVGPEGLDCSPRGDPAGFVRVRDKHTVLIPDRRGNNRVDTFGNILASPGVGLIFLVPGINETLRVNGRAQITQDPALLTPLAVQNVAPTIGLKVHVDECYFHCGKALIRSKLWDPKVQVERHSFPTLGRIVAEQTAAVSVDVAAKTMEEAYRTRLY